jgi:hypothetical protein
MQSILVGPLGTPSRSHQPPYFAFTHKFYRSGAGDEAVARLAQGKVTVTA